MICVSLSDKNINTCLEALQETELAEVRLDLTQFPDEDVKTIFAQPKKIIATYRPVEGIDDETRKQQLKLAIKSGANYVDIEYESPIFYRKEMVEYAKENNCDVIISYHNYDETPSNNDLRKIVNDCYFFGADVAKIATQVTELKDVANVLSFYDTDKRMVSIGMGELGKITRIMALFLGAEFSFAAPDGGEKTAPGQLTVSELEKYVEQLKTL
jgi:3-dehydroquinate dehydratase-1